MGHSMMDRAAAHQGPGSFLEHLHPILHGSMRAVEDGDPILVGRRSACFPRSATSWTRSGATLQIWCRTRLGQESKAAKRGSQNQAVAGH